MRFTYRRMAAGALVLITALAAFHTFGPQGRGRSLAGFGQGQNRRACREIFETVCQERGETRDLTGVVRVSLDGEIRANEFREKIERRFPHWPAADVNEELARRIYTPDRRARLESAYEWVEKAMVRFIEAQPSSVFNAGEKGQLLRRVRRTHLQLPPPASLYRDEPALLTGEQVFYERSIEARKPMRMRVGGSYVLSVTSWFNMVFTMAHELAHAIDPCEIRSARLAIPAYDRLSACFLKQGLIAARSTRRECGKNDQLSETFADWVAVQLTAEALREHADEYEPHEMIEAAVNSVRDLCEDSPDTEFHPAPRIRIERIFGADPAIREVLGCVPGDDPLSACRF